MAPRRSIAPTLHLTEVEPSHHRDHRAFHLNFFGTRLNVTLTHKTSAVRRWIRNVRHHGRNYLRLRRFYVALGLGGELNENHVSTIHLCVGRECLIIQLGRLLNDRRRRRASVPPILKHFFSDDRIVFVGLLNRGHASKLQRSEIAVANLHDAKDLLFGEDANPSYNEVVNAAEIHNSYSQFDLNPQVTYSNWTKTDLDEAQITQAAADAFLRYKVGTKILSVR